MTVPEATSQTTSSARAWVASLCLLAGLCRTMCGLSALSGRILQCQHSAPPYLAWWCTHSRQKRPQGLQLSGRKA